MNARYYYDPELGQFISPDDLIPDPTNVLAYNRYLYGMANPMKYNDPATGVTGSLWHQAQSYVMLTQNVTTNTSAFTWFF